MNTLIETSSRKKDAHDTYVKQLASFSIYSDDASEYKREK